MTGLKGQQWQDKRNSNGRGERRGNGSIRGMAVTEKVECQRENKKKGNDRAKGVAMTG